MKNKTMEHKTIESNGSSARRKAIQNIRRHLMLVCLLSTTVYFFSCQEDGKGQDLALGTGKNVMSGDSLHKPKVNITVNKRYDDQGNLIGMDSSYSAFYSNIAGDTAAMDTLFERFDRYFNDHRVSPFDQGFYPLFFSDSLRYHDFFHNDFFLKRYELNDPYLRDMMYRMDSIKNDFFRRNREPQKNPADL